MSNLYLTRKIDAELQKWFEEENRLPLIVKGPRQVGKTESILHFARKNYQNIIYINFVEEPKYKSIVEYGYKPDDIIRLITLVSPETKFTAGSTLIFFDELQEFPEIATALKFFKIDGRFDVICSGYLLGISYHRIESNSVGYKQDLLMSSLDFEEFLWACGYDKFLRDDMLSHLQSRLPFSALEMETYSRLFLDYCICGGMPAVLCEYIETKTFQNVLQKQRMLIADFREDIRKYAGGLDQSRILSVFEQIPVQLAKENKKFQLSKISRRARSRDYWGCIEWLQDTGLAKICWCLNSPSLPLKGNYDPSSFKLYFFDSGLFISMLDDEAQQDLRENRNFGIYKGALYENIAAEILVKQGYSLYYWKKADSTLETDFFIRTAKWLVPVEVKAKKGKSRSMDELIENEKYDEICFGLKISAQNIGFSKQVFTIPYFCAFLLKDFLKNPPVFLEGGQNETDEQ